MRYRYKMHPHASYNRLEGMFVCLICEKRDIVKKVFYPWEIPIHLKEKYKINRSQQKILGWTKDFEEEYLKNRKKPVEHEYEDSIDVRKEKQGEIRKEKTRLEEERKTKRDGY